MATLVLYTSVIFSTSVLVGASEPRERQNVFGTRDVATGHLMVNAGGVVRRVEGTGAQRMFSQPIQSDWGLVLNKTHSLLWNSISQVPVSKILSPQGEQDLAWQSRSLARNSSSQALAGKTMVARVAEQVQQPGDLTSLGKEARNNEKAKGHLEQLPGIQNHYLEAGHSPDAWKHREVDSNESMSIDTKAHVVAHQKQMTRAQEKSKAAVEVQSRSKSKTDDRQMPTAERAVVVVQSWVLFHVMRDHASYFGAPMDKGSIAVQNAIADALDLCRPAVRVTDARAFDIGNFERVLMQFGTHGTLQRRESIAPPRYAEVFKLIEVRLSFSIPIFTSMGYNASQVNARVDHLQSFAAFADLDLLLASALRDVGAGNGAGLDDIGEGEIHHASDDGPFTSITADEVADCLAEDDLRLARHHHHIVMVLSFALLALITCAGVALFTAQRSVVVRNRLQALPSSLVFGRD